MHLLTLVAAVNEAEIPVEKRIAISMYCTGVVDGGNVLLAPKCSAYEVERFLNDYIVVKPYLARISRRVVDYYKELKGAKVEDLLPLVIDEYDWWQMDVKDDSEYYQIEVPEVVTKRVQHSGRHKKSGGRGSSKGRELSSPGSGTLRLKNRNTRA